MDSFLTQESRNIGAGYSFFLIYGLIFAIIGVIFHLFSVFVFWNNQTKRWWNGGNWWLFVLPPFAFLGLVGATACFLKGKEDKKTMTRHFQVYMACKRVEEKYLKKSGIFLTPGVYGAWIEVISQKPFSNFFLNIF